MKRIDYFMKTQLKLLWEIYSFLYKILGKGMVIWDGYGYWWSKLVKLYSLVKNFRPFIGTERIVYDYSEEFYSIKFASIWKLGKYWSTEQTRADQTQNNRTPGQRSISYHILSNRTTNNTKVFQWSNKDV